MVVDAMMKKIDCCMYRCGLCSKAGSALAVSFMKKLRRKQRLRSLQQRQRGLVPKDIAAEVAAAFASQLKRELQVHALRSLPPGAAAVLGAARGLAVALAVAAGA